MGSGVDKKPSAYDDSWKRKTVFHRFKFFKCEVLKRYRLKFTHSRMNLTDLFVNFTDKNVKFKNEIFPVINVH